MLMQKNPELHFALEESYPLKGTYGDAVPLGPIMELRAQDGEKAFTAERAAQSLDYWQTTTQRLLSEPETSDLSEVLNAYSHDVTAAANLLAARNYSGQAEQAYRLSSQLAPSNIEAVMGLSELLAGSGRGDEARQLLAEFERKYPDKQAAVETFRGSVVFSAKLSGGK